jgi:murein DD-endopeptidase MepM/ murein hydrolase activator NlpD
VGILKRRLRAGERICSVLGMADRREVIIRSSGRVLYIPLPGVAQLFLLLIVAGIGVWVAHASAIYYRHYDLIAGKEAQLAAVEQRNLALVARVSAMRNQFSDATGTLARSQRTLVELTESNAALERDLQDLRGKLNESESRRAEQTRRQVALNQQLMALQAELNRSEHKGVELAERLEEAKATLASAFMERSAVESTRDWLKLRVKGLEDQQAEFKAAQRGVLIRLNRRTATDIERMERLIESTGLQIAQFVEEMPDSGTATGGPFVSAAAASTPRAGVSGIEAFERQMARWEALQDAVFSLPLVAPMTHYRLSSSFGGRKDPINGRAARHDGIDLAGPMRSPIYASAPGRVVHAGWKGALGRTVEIDHGNGILTRYAHLQRTSVKRGQKVSFGQKIGQLGTSGRSTGPHLHYEIRVNGKAVDPEKFIKAGRDVFKG